MQNTVAVHSVLSAHHISAGCGQPQGHAFFINSKRTSYTLSPGGWPALAEPLPSHLPFDPQPCLLDNSSTMFTPTCVENDMWMSRTCSCALPPAALQATARYALAQEQAHCQMPPRPCTVASTEDDPILAASDAAQRTRTRLPTPSLAQRSSGTLALPSMVTTVSVLPGVGCFCQGGCVL